MVATTNVLVALKNILDRNSSILTPIFRSNGSVNAAGDSLEFFVKDMFCTGASQYQYEHEKKAVYNRYLSWNGDSKHFPDFIVKNGVGVEPKKLNNTARGSLALNSSYPKDYIYPDSQNLPGVSYIREDSPWDKKEVIYVVGNLKKETNKLISLWMVYGNTFVADREIYLNLINEVREAIAQTNATLQESLELARATGIDPLRRSNLRVRGMYELNHPVTVFGNFIENEDRAFPSDCTRIYLVILSSDLQVLEASGLSPDFTSFYNSGKLIRKNIGIPDPNNPGASLEAVLFCGYTD